MRRALIALLQVAVPAGATELDPGCAVEVRATSVAERFSDLPSEIQDDLVRMTGERIGERSEQLLETDAPSSEEQNFVRARFAQALLVENEWFVQIEVAMTSGVRTFGYVREDQGIFRRRLSHYFGGPACASIEAALAGVYNPGQAPP